MKYLISTFLLFFCLLNGFSQAFITTWKTDNFGQSEDNQITIPTVFGLTYDYTVDWGDGNIDSGVTGAITHTYDSPGTYTVSITGTFPRIRLAAISPSGIVSPGDYRKILTIEQWGANSWTTMQDAFAACENLTINATDAPDLTNVSSMVGMFKDADAFNQNISHWDVSDVTDMSSLFLRARSFNQDISLWNVSSVTNMSNMFAGSPFDQDISSWNVSMVTNMSSMFEGSGFNQDIGSWDVSAVTNMSSMFEATSFNQDISTWNVSGVTTMRAMFDRNVVFDQPIGSWNVGNVSNMSSMFSGADAFNQNIGSWDVSNVTNMSDMFVGTDLFQQNIDSWDVSSVSNMSRMFRLSAFDQPIGSWNVSNVTNMYWMFYSANFNQDIGNWDVGKVTDMSSMFWGALSFNQNISNWDVSAVVDMGSMFWNAISFNQDISSWNVSLVNDMSTMFGGAATFDQNLGSWDIRNVTDMFSMFISCGLSRQNYDNILIGWAAQNVQNDIRIKTSSGYCTSESARNTLINDFNWTIEDEGYACNTQTDFLSFEIEQQFDTPQIDTDNHKITGFVTTSDLTNLTPEFVLSDEATSDPVSDLPQNFNNPVTYTVTAEDGETVQDWLITIQTVSSETDIVSFSFPEQATDAIINLVNHTVSVEVLFGTNVSSLTPSITTSENASLAPGSDEPRDFSSMVSYTVTAQDGVAAQEWEVSVSVAANIAANISSFSLAEQTGDAIIDIEASSIEIEVVHGTNVNQLSPTIEVSSNATVNPESGSPVDFTNPVSFTVTAENQAFTKAWLVTVSVAPRTATDILSFTVPGQTQESTIDQINHTVNLQVSFETDLVNLTPTIELSDGATISPGGDLSRDFSSELIYVVTAEDMTTSQEWSVRTVQEEAPLSVHNMEKVEVYPNPASDKLLVRGSTRYDRIEILDTNGRLLVNLKLESEDSENEIRLNFEPGIYVYRIFQNDTPIKEAKIILK